MRKALNAVRISAITGKMFATVWKTSVTGLRIDGIARKTGPTVLRIYATIGKTFAMSGMTAVCATSWRIFATGRKICVIIGKMYATAVKTIATDWKTGLTAIPDPSSPATSETDTGARH